MTDVYLSVSREINLPIQGRGLLPRDFFPSFSSRVAHVRPSAFLPKLFAFEQKSRNLPRPCRGVGKPVILRSCSGFPTPSRIALHYPSLHHPRNNRSKILEKKWRKQNWKKILIAEVSAHGKVSKDKGKLASKLYVSNFDIFQTYFLFLLNLIEIFDHKCLTI